MGFFIIFILIVLIRGMVVILHELGHAIPAIILTKQQVSIYIGSYGEREKSINFTIGLLDVWISYKMQFWRNGLCSPSAKNISINKQVIYILCGPLCAMFLASLFLYFAISFELNDSFMLFGALFFVLSIVDFFGNLVPNDTPITLANGGHTINDGAQLIRLFKYKKFVNEHKGAVQLFNDKEYEKSTELLEYLLESGLREVHIYKMITQAYIQLKNYERARFWKDEYLRKFKLDSDDYSNAGLIFCRLHLNEEALLFFDQSLEINPVNIYSLNNKGFALMVLERYEESIHFFDKALEVDSNFAYSLSNRGLSKIKTGNLEDGLLDIQKSMQLDASNSYCYRNLGIYHFEIGEKEKAKELFLKSKEMDPETYLIDDLILSTERFYSE